MRLLRPKDRIVFTFESDNDLPIEDRPRLIGKVLSVADSKKMMAMANSGPERTAMLDRIVDGAMVGLTDWENVIHPDTGEPIPFSRDSLAEWLTIEELSEVVNFLAGRLTVDERKKSESPPSSNAANSVPPATDSVATT